MDKKVIFVDDEEMILTMLATLAKSRGYEPYCVENGLEALEIIEKEHIHILFTDLRMPKIDGMELCKRAKAHNPSLHVFAVSAFVDAYSEEQFKEAGFDGFFQKPFMIDDILNTCAIAFEKVAQENNE